MNKIKAKLILEDGTEFLGDSFGASIESFGEIVFNTGMTGYQEILSDPSYCGQIVTMTYPLIGNYGINDDDFESLRPHVHGFIVKEHCEAPSNWRSKSTVDELLKKYDIPGIQGIDTRKLTKIIREHGTMRAVIVPGELDDKANFRPIVENTLVSPDDHLKLAKDKLRNPLMTNQVDIVSTKSQFRCPGDGYRIVLVDYGYKQGILKSLINHGCDVTVVPHNISASEIDSINPDGIVLSNGPGDPKDVPHALDFIRKIQERYPTMGICMGHQLFALANGADTAKMKFGHRGCNHPVKDLASSKVFISSQNHGFTVTTESILGAKPADDDELESELQKHISATEYHPEAPLQITHINVNDKTVEGLRHTKHKAFSVQFHPEALPGPKDTAFLFDKFFAMIKETKALAV